MSAKVDRINEEINKMRTKIADYQTRLRELERLKIETENAEIIAMVRGVDVAPDELRAFISAYQKQKADVPPSPAGQEDTENED